MNGATPTHPMTSLAPPAAQPRRGPRTTLRGGVVLMLFLIVLEGAFLLDVARPLPGAGDGPHAGALGRDVPGALV